VQDTTGLGTRGSGLGLPTVAAAAAKVGIRRSGSGAGPVAGGLHASGQSEVGSPGPRLPRARRSWMGRRSSP